MLPCIYIPHITPFYCTKNPTFLTTLFLQSSKIFICGGFVTHTIRALIVASVRAMVGKTWGQVHFFENLFHLQVVVRMLFHRKGKKCNKRFNTGANTKRKLRYVILGIFLTLVTMCVRSMFSTPAAGTGDTPLTPIFHCWYLQNKVITRSKENCDIAAM